MALLVDRIKKLDGVLIAILAIGLALRLWGINFGLPFMLNVDEPRPVDSALQMLNTGNLDPGFFYWPSLLMYLNAIVYGAYFLLNPARGAFGHLPLVDVEGTGIARAPSSELILLGRGLTAFFGVWLIVVVYLIARRMGRNKWVGWLAALSVAVEPTNVRFSQLIRPDELALCLALVSFYCALKILDDPGFKFYILAGIAAGLAASAKYTLGIIVVAIVVVHLIKRGVRAPLRGEIWLAAFASVLAFFGTTPYAVLNWRQFIAGGIAQDAAAYLPGDAQSTAASIAWYANYLWANLGLGALLALGGALYLLIRRDKPGIALLSFLAGYLAFINSFVAHVDGNILPAIPFLCILASLFISAAYDFLQKKFSIHRRWVSAAMTCLVVLLLLPPLQVTASNDYRLTLSDGRFTANAWIEQNVPAGSRIALESWAPYVDRHKFTVASFGLMIDHPPDWYVSNGFEYLVFSEGSYGRSFTQPERYAKYVPQYDAFFSRFTEVARFDDHNFEIRIFKTDVRLPAQRVGARFGDAGDLIELIGYDTSNWQLGEPLRVTLYWRALAGKHEPLQLETRLLGADDQTIAVTQEDLFLGKGWQAGMFSIDWLAPPPNASAPGAYRLQVKVVQTRFNGYHPPAFNSADQVIDPVLLGPFILSTR